jgi:hypothetical protein
MPAIEGNIKNGLKIIEEDQDLNENIFNQFECNIKNKLEREIIDENNLGAVNR